MNATLTVAVVAAVVFFAGALIFFILRGRQRSRQEEARQRYGIEYERTTQELGSEREAERDLRKRREWIESEIRPLSTESREHYDGRWRRVERTFQRDPGTALEEADRVVSEVLKERNYPVDSRREARKGLGVMHPKVVEDFLEAQRIRQESVGSHEEEASPEKMRLAIRKYRAVYATLKKE